MKINHRNRKGKRILVWLYILLIDVLVLLALGLAQVPGVIEGWLVVNFMLIIIIILGRIIDLI